MKRNIVACCLLLLFCSPLVISVSGVENPVAPLHSGDTIDTVNDAGAEVVLEGNIQGKMPPTAIIIAGIMVPITAIVGFFVFLVVYARLNHRKAMAMIEKGIYQSTKWRWDVIVLFIGLVFSFVGIGVSLTTIGFFGPEPWTFATGCIPFLLGISFIVFSWLYRNRK